jgi:predicted RND superfamily exporter protein
MEEFQKYAMKQTDPTTNKNLIGDALSLADFVSYMNRIMKDDPNENRVPDSRNLIAQYLLTYESQSEGELSTLVDYKYNKAQIIVRLPDMSSTRLNVIIANLKQYIKDHPIKEIQISWSGAAEINAEFATLIVRGQIWSLALSLLIIMISYMIFFRSYIAGVLAAVPLFCAITLVFGIMGVMHIPLDYVTATLTGISIGAGTDYTAYFLWRLRERTKLHGNLEDGYASTMTSIGKGIVYNGFSVVVGFFVFFFSAFIPIRFFGFLVSFSILACIVSTLSVLPVVIFMVKPKFLMQRAASKDIGLEVPMSVVPRDVQPEAQSMVRFVAKSPLETAAIEDQS